VSLQPTVVAAYAEADRIVVSNNGGILGMGLNAFIGPAGIGQFAKLQMPNGTKAPKTTYRDLKKWQ
jgi:hypothetical protein